MNTDDSLDLMTIFTQSRSDAFIHYVAIGQRLNDISTKVIERLRPFIGLTLGENSLRKIKSQLPEHLKDRVQQLPKRHWLYLNGKENPEIVIAEYKKEGSPNQLKQPIPEQPQQQILTLKDRLKLWLNPTAIKDMAKPTLNSFLNEEKEESKNEDEQEENSDLEEIEEEWIN